MKRTQDLSYRSSTALLIVTMRQPVTVIAATVGAVGLFFMLAMHAGIFAWIAAVGGAAIAGVSWAVNYFIRSDSFLRLRQQSALQDAKMAQEESLNALKKALRKCQFLEGSENTGEKAVGQFEQVVTRFSNFQKLLNDKFNPTEITYERYRSVAEQVYLSVLDHLQEVAANLQSIHAMGIESAQERLSELQRLPQLTAELSGELAALKDRLVIKTQLEEKIALLLSYNEKALTDIDQASLAISELKSASARASVSLDASMSELEELAKRAHRYQT